MSKLLRFVVLLVLLSSTRLAAQTTSVAPPPPLAAADSGAVLLFNGWYLPRYQPSGAAADSTGALLSLFRKRRYAGWLYAIPFIAGMSLALPIATTDHYGYGQTTVADEAISPPIGFGVIGATVAAFIVHATTFNKAHLLAVDEAYAAGKPIPAKYRNKLNAQHFAEAAYLREALRQQMEREQLQIQLKQD